MDNIVSAKLDSRYASTLGVWQYDYGQVLRITGPELPPAVEVQFSLDEKSGETLSRVGTTVDGVTEVKIPDELLKHSATSNYWIYAYIYLTDETSGNTKYEITIPVRVRSKPTSPAEDPETDPDLFRETVVAVNASAERAENAASSAMESAASADETLAEIKRVADGISGNIENANTMKSELSDMINNAGIDKKELESSIGKAGEAKMALDSSIRSAGEKQLALDATVEHANTVDVSLKEHIGSAEQIQANVEQIATNKKDIASLKEDLSNKITKFYASNQGETHITDSDNGKIQDMIIYGRSSQFTTTGKNLANGQNVKCYINSSASICGVTDNDTGMVIDASKLTNVTISTRSIQDRYRVGCTNTVPTKEGPITCYNGRIKDGTKDSYTIDTTNYNYLIVNATKLEDIQVEKGSEATSYEPYTGGIPSPSPDYPQEIKRVVNPVIKVCEANILNIKNAYETVNSRNGLTYSVKNGVIKVKGTATSNFGIGLTLETASGSLELKKNNTYIFNPNSKKVEDNNAYLDLTNSRSLGISIKSNNVNKPIKPTEKDVKYLFSLAVRVKQGATIDMEWKPQLLLNESLLPYKPYTEQSVILPVTLNAIPVSSGGNVIIDGKQYIADRVVEKDGVFGIERNIREIHTNTKTMNNSEEYPGWNKVEGITDVTYYNVDPIGASRILTFISNFTRSTLCQNNIKPNNIVYFIKNIIGYSQSELIAKAIDVDMYIRLQDAIFEPLPWDIQAKLRTLVTNYPVTNISVTSDQLDGYTVFNYPISMANGWNYVKQQLGDTRDYIYDMDAKAQDIDIQSAEAYVNSEYAVALTELEV